MKIAVLGGGFTGLTAALRLLQKGHQVTIFEKEGGLGGLAIGFKNPRWQWTLEKAYHHWFTNDYSVLNLARDIGQKVITKRPETAVFVNGRNFPFDNTLALLRFPYLPLIDRLRMGLVVLFLKITNNYTRFERQKSLPWIRRFMGKRATELIWEPLFSGKFGSFKDEISLTWFWARIKKRTPSLAYPEGGFQVFADKLGDEIKRGEGKILLNTSVMLLESHKDGCKIKTKDQNYIFDKVIVTLPTPIFTKIATSLPSKYIKKISAIAHLHAHILILIFKKPFLRKTYWLNITDKNFPFLVLAEHTNFMDPKHYGGQHILYIGNYLPLDHPYLKMTKEELLKIFDPYLRKINPTYHLSLISCQLFIGPFAQPIITLDYPNLMSTFKTPLKNVFLANLDMVYPWDRGTNYAVEMGEKVAKLIND